MYSMKICSWVAIGICVYGIDLLHLNPFVFIAFCILRSTFRWCNGTTFARP
jgi:hypothetical protein